MGFMRKVLGLRSSAHESVDGFRPDPILNVSSPTPRPTEGSSPFFEDMRDESIGQGQFRILFVCTGNICRSAAAAAIARRIGQRKAFKWIVDSAGTQAVVGSAIDDSIAEVMLLEDRELATEHMAKQLDFSYLNAADIVFVFDESHFKWILAELPECIEKIVPLGKIHDIRALEPMALQDLIRKNLQIPTRPEHWIDDPYRMGPEAAKSAVSRIYRELQDLAEVLD